MFSLLDEVNNFSKWISTSPIGWIILNPFLLSLAITLIIVILHEYYSSDDSDSGSGYLTKFVVYSFLAVFIPVMINNNVIDRKRIEGSYEMSEDDFILH